MEERIPREAMEVTMKKTPFFILTGLLLSAMLVSCSSEPVIFPADTAHTQMTVASETTSDVPETDRPSEPTETKGTYETSLPPDVQETTPSAEESESVDIREPETTPETADTMDRENVTTGEEPETEEIMYYQNPILTADTENAWPGYGFGDPFVMRYNGVYYLYVSTKDGYTGIKCWSSTDLVHWSYEGFCTRDKITKGAYAPEVYYYNGYFYMYTSPAGNGHYVLRSTSPTEGFEPITDNMGMSIDGSVFIDNDGEWYFYTAGHGGMMAYKMTSPSEMISGHSMSAITVNKGWTEGPMVVFHDGYYYLTYTGNHVLSKSYRIYYGVSKRSPLAYGNILAHNPLLINTSDEVFGIGHSSTVKGPDLDSYYIVYHSLVNMTPNRNTNIDRIVFNGESMEIMGPTTDKQQVPDMPDVYHYFKGGTSLSGWRLTGSFGSTGGGLPLGADSTLISKQAFEGDYTAEYNVTAMADGARAGAVFSYTDEQNFGTCLFDPATQQVIISMTVNGETVEQRVDMIRSFGEDVRFDCLQSLQVERSGRDYTFYMNDRRLCTVKDSPLGGGAIGYVTEGGEASFGFIGGTGAVGGRGMADTYKIVSELNGLIPAISYSAGSFKTVKADGKTLVSAEAGDILSYRVLAAADGIYDLTIQYRREAVEADVSLEIRVDGVAVATVSLTAREQLSSAVCRGIPMTQGQHELSFKLTDGDADFLKFTLLKSEAVDPSSVMFGGARDSSVYVDGSWRQGDGQLTLSGDHASGKRLYGDKNWGDYTVEVWVTPLQDPNCGLLVRATNPGAPNFMSNPPSAEDAQTGTDWVEGYFVGLLGDAVVLGKQSYGYRELTRAEGSFQAGNEYHLRVVCEGARLQVYVDGTLYIDYTDPDPFMQGMVGVRAYQCSASFEDLTVSADCEG